MRRSAPARSRAVHTISRWLWCIHTLRTSGSGYKASSFPAATTYGSFRLEIPQCNSAQEEIISNAWRAAGAQFQIFSQLQRKTGTSRGTSTGPESTLMLALTESGQSTSGSSLEIISHAQSTLYRVVQTTTSAWKSRTSVSSAEKDPYG